MTDLVERLLEPVDYLPREVRQEAAAEIVRLREQVASLQASSGYEASIAQLDIDRLRAALQSIHDVYDKPEYHNPTILEIARRALEPKP